MSRNCTALLAVIFERAINPKVLPTPSTSLPPAAFIAEACHIIPEHVWRESSYIKPLDILSKLRQGAEEAGGWNEELSIDVLCYWSFGDVNDKSERNTWRKLIAGYTTVGEKFA